MYDSSIATHQTQLAHESLAKFDRSVIDPGSLSDSPINSSSISALCGGTDISEVQVNIDWEVPGFDATDIPRRSNSPQCRQQPSNTMLNPLCLDNDDTPHVISGFRTRLDSEDISLTNLFQSTWTTRNRYLSTLSRFISTSGQIDNDFLVRLQISNPVADFTATVLMEMLRAFPQMMLRRETMPPFIHGHWYGLTSPTEASLLPEPLVNCIGVAQIFASYNAESRPFLWRTIKLEQASFLEKVWPFSFLQGILGEVKSLALD